MFVFFGKSDLDAENDKSNRIILIILETISSYVMDKMVTEALTDNFCIYSNFLGYN